MKDFQVKFIIKAVVGVTVSADNFDDAKEKGIKAFHKPPLFPTDFEYIDGNNRVIGIDDIEGWDTTVE